jgi:uncharacterized protein (TIGR02453 family)
MHLKALIEFLSGLEQNNNRPWFAWNKPAYDLLREEFEALLTDVIARVGKFDRALGPVDARKAMFRIYRDTRFYKDKTRTGRTSARHADRQARTRQGYFPRSTTGRDAVGGRIYRPEPDRCASAATSRPNRNLDDIAAHRVSWTYGRLMEEDSSCTAEGSADMPHIEAIKLHYFGLAEANLKKRPPKDLARDLAGYFEDLYPLMVWLRKAGAENPKNA